MAHTLARAAFAVAVLAGLTLAGCSSSTPADDAPTSDSNGYEAPDDAEMGDAALMVADSSLGEIVVDADGMTVYMFDSDEQGSGTSTCEGQCAENWPAVTTDSDVPAVADDVTGEVGTITGVDGSTQITLNGWPLYYFAGDSAAGDVNGQAVNDVWWVLTPDGERMTG